MAENTDSYGVNSIIEYATYGGGIRRVLVRGRDAEIKNGQSGFDGVLVDDQNVPVPQRDNMVWGYDSQITKVVQR